MPSNPGLQARWNTVAPSSSVGMLVEYDPGRLAGQQPHQLRLALAERQRPQVRLQQVERIQDRVKM
jgi:hypothetical protein